MKCLLLLLLLSSSLLAKSPILSVLSEKGLPARVTVCVRDQGGNVVSNALVTFSFGVSSQKKSNIFKTLTNGDGLASGESLVNQKITLTIEKKGYYCSYYKYSVWNGSSGYESGRWEPWDPTIEVILYEIVNPRNDQYFPCSTFLYEPNIEYGVDLLQRKIVSIENENSVYDFKIKSTGSYYSCNISREDDWVAKDNISFCHPGDGMITQQRNVNSDLSFQYEAPLVGYEDCVNFECFKKNKKKNIVRGYPSDNKQYIVFRITRNSDDGESHYYYGIIEYMNFSKNMKTGKPIFCIQYRLNPEPGDRNIEYTW